MSLVIDTCNDVEKYEASVVAGMNFKKTIYMFIGIGVGALVAFLFFWFMHLSIYISVYGATPITGAIIIIGVYEKDGQSLIQIMKKRFAKNAKKPNFYISTENAETYAELKKSTIIANENINQNPDEIFDKTIKKIKIIALALVVAIILIVAIIAILLHVL